MNNIPMCRICLAVEVRMYSIVGTPLQRIYEKITNGSITEANSGAVCYICHSYLRKYLLLEVTARKAQELLNNARDSVEQKNVLLTCTVHKYIVTPVVYICTDGSDNFVKNEQLQIPCKKELEDIATNDLDGDSDPNFTCDNLDQSDPEDDVPLQKFRTETGPVKVARVKKKRKMDHIPKVDNGEGFLSEFATEIILSKEDQIRELKQRSESINYLNSPMKCDMCYRGFVCPKAYGNHMDKHEEKSGPHKCDVCQMRYLSAKQLRSHMAMSHERRYSCKKCSQLSHTAHQAREHEKWHSGFTYECKLCGHAFRKYTSYLTHKRKRHPTRHVCKLCGEGFGSRHGLLMHRSKSHREAPPVESTEPSKRYCSECQIQFTNVDAWKRHVLINWPHTNNSHSLQCCICEEQLPSTAALRKHIRQHEKSLKAKPVPLVGKIVAELPCEQCGSKFSNRSKLQSHIRRIHLGLKYNKNVVCELCGKHCTSNATLMYHQRTHTGERPHRCGICNKGFVDGNQLRIHTRTHTGEKPYCCSTCGQRFSQKPALNRHNRVHTGAKPYMCQHCSKCFTQSNSLKLHIRTVHLKQPVNRKKQYDLTVDGKIEKSLKSSDETVSGHVAVPLPSAQL